MSVFKASALNLCALAQRYKQTSKKYEVYFNIFQSECSVFSGFSQRYTKNIKKVLFPVICCQASLKRKRNVPFSKEWLIMRNVPISLVLPTCAPMHAHVS